MQTPNPQDISWDPFNNPYNQRAYERICSEFQVSVKADWRISGSNNGLGKAYFQWGDKQYVQNPVKMVNGILVTCHLKRKKTLLK